MGNTEKPMAKAEQKRQGIVKTSKYKKDLNVPAKTETEEKKKEIVQGETKEEVSKIEEKKETKMIIKVKKTEAYAKGNDLPISTKVASGICKNIKGKPIENAIKNLEMVALLKKVMPLKGEFAHKKGKGIMSGKYPQKAAKVFIKILKNISANANNNGLSDPIISEAYASIASRPYGRFGRIRRKRTNLKISAKERKIKNKTK